MSNRLVVAYDLKNADEGHYKTVQAAIAAVGDAEALQFSMFTVLTGLSAQQAYSKIFEVLKPQDSLVVIEANGVVMTTSQKPHHGILSMLSGRPVRILPAF